MGENIATMDLVGKYGICTAKTGDQYIDLAVNEIHIHPDTHEVFKVGVLTSKKNNVGVNKFVTGAIKFSYYSYNTSMEVASKITDGTMINVEKGGLTFIGSTPSLRYSDANYQYYINESIVPNVIEISFDECDDELHIDMMCASYFFQLQQSHKVMQQVKEGVKRILLSNYPYGLQDEWLEYFLDLVCVPQYCTLLKAPLTHVLSKSKYRYVHFNFPVEHGLEIIPIAYGMYQFYTKFNTIPKIKELCLLINPDKFNIKKFKDFKNLFSDDFNVEDKKDVYEDDVYRVDTTKLALIYFFEIFSHNYKEVLEFMRQHEIDIYAFNYKGAAIKLCKSPQINSDFIFKCLKSIVKYCQEVSKAEHKIYRYFSLFLSTMDQIPEIEKLANSPKELINAISVLEYKDIKQGAEIVAKIACSLMLSEESFEDYQDLYLKSAKKFMKAPRSIPTLGGNIKNTPYSWEFMTIEDPRSMFVGLETNCCQHLHGVGQSCVEYMANNPETSGIFRVTKNDNTVAQSFVWFDQNSGIICCDNIEVLGGELNDNIRKAYHKFAKMLRNYSKIFGYRAITIGVDNSDLDLSEYKSVSHNKIVNPLIEENVYTDATMQVYLMKF